MTLINHLNNVKAKRSCKKYIFVIQEIAPGTWDEENATKIIYKIDPWFLRTHRTRLNLMFSKSGRKGKQTMWKRGRGEAWGLPKQVAEVSRCCREAAKEIMSCLDYLQGLITVERLIWVSSKPVLQGSAVPSVVLMVLGLICPETQWFENIIV